MQYGGERGAGGCVVEGARIFLVLFRVLRAILVVLEPAFYPCVFELDRTLVIST